MILLRVFADKVKRNLTNNCMRNGVHVNDVCNFLTSRTFQRYHYLWYTPEVAPYLCRRDLFMHGATPWIIQKLLLAFVRNMHSKRLCVHRIVKLRFSSRNCTQLYSIFYIVHLSLNVYYFDCTFS